MKTSLKKQKRGFTVLGIIFIIFCIGVAVYIKSTQKTESINLTFHSNIEVYVGDKLTVEALVKETNAEHVKIISGNTDVEGEQKVVVKATKNTKEKEFSTLINVRKKQITVNYSNKSKVENNDGKKKNVEDQTNNNSKVTEKSENNSTSNKATQKEEDTYQKPSVDQKPNQSKDPVDNEQQVIPEESDLTEQQFANEVFNLINEYRTSNGLPAYSTNNIIQSVADQRANDMAVMGYASHKRPDGNTADSLWISENYGIVAGGENVFGGTYGFMPKAVVDSWIASPGHERLFVADYNRYMAIGVRYAQGQVFVSANFQQ